MFPELSRMFPELSRMFPELSRMFPELRPELLLIGTQSDLLAYDVENNTDHFFKEVADGVNVLTHGSVPMVDVPMVVAGGNCSIQGFDAEGNEPFWTVTGDNVRCVSNVR
jgi:Bardet-Biedl syndrome 2 protein